MTAQLTRVSVLTSCTGRKVSQRSAVRAEELYCGQQHVRLMRGVRRLREADVDVDVHIVSAGHGVVPGEMPLAPYDKTFSGMRAHERRDMAEELGIPAAVEAALGAGTDLGVVTLGEEYLDACQITERLTPGAPTLLLCSASASIRLGTTPNVRVIALRAQHTRAFKCGYVGLKGEVGGRLLAALAEGRLTVEDVMAGDILASLSELAPTSHSKSSSAAIALF